MEDPSRQKAPTKPCFHFQRGACKFGDRCKYSHGTTGTITSRNESVNRNAHQREHFRDGKLSEWKRLLQQGSQLSRATSTTSRFFELGLQLMDGDLGAAQETIKHLAGDKGLAFIKDVTDRHILVTGNTGSQLSIWASEIKPLFLLTTHPRIIDSAVLEQEVATIYNFLIGVGGDRMIRLFGFIDNAFQDWSESTATEPLIAAMELSLTVLSKIIEINTPTLVNARLRSLVDRFSKSLDGASKDEFSHLQSRKYLEYIKQRLEIGDGIPGVGATSQVVPREAFVLRKDFPGMMSADGPRHDNDHVDISNIRILPTAEEIVSPREEYLPTNDPLQWHIQGIRGRLDREFRLLREDTIGQLRDAVRQTLEGIRNPGKSQSSHNRSSVRTYDYDSPKLMALEFDISNGLQLLVRCKQPRAVQNMATNQRKQWWGQSKRLQSGGLVCVANATGSVLFCVVSDSTIRERKPEDEASDGSETEAESFTLSGDKDYLFVKLHFFDPGKYEVGKALRWYCGVRSSMGGRLVEFPGILLPSFIHTLTALQQMYKQPSIPFGHLLAPDANAKPEDRIMKAPLYARKGSFDLACLTDDESSFMVNTQKPPEPEELASRSTLDLTQSSAVLSSFSRELCLIQGPPGTGKSYTGEKIIKALLANTSRAKLGPILCVCYTNHALDQLLEHLLDDGIKNIIRIGSRSKSDRLQDLNLRMVVPKFDRTKSEKSGLYALDQTLRNTATDTREQIGRLSGFKSRELKDLLSEAFPTRFEELFGKSGDGWETVNNDPKRTVDKWLRGGSKSGMNCRQLDELKLSPLSGMNHMERRLIFDYWMRSIREPIISEILQLHTTHKEAKEQRDRIRGDVDLRCLQQAQVVGVTTTGLARKLQVLQKLRCKVMLCEEAGEVLEAHILTALLPSLESVILIGDHLQLRPQIQNYDLQSTNPRGEQYSLDVSLFERLVQPPHATDLPVPFNTLETQRRMHPFISDLIRSTLYPSLKDAEVVSNYPEVVGMKERLFWLHHENLEAAATNNDALDTSHSNEFEVEMVAALVSHLIRQGEYKQGEIAVITPYLGQLFKLRRRMERMFEICLGDRDLDGLDEFDALSETLPQPQQAQQTAPSKSTLLSAVRIATVDNFQGEEAKVIVISLVRSNPENRCGFLRTPNRINVLLSRAQHGMYIIGNSNTYRSIQMWDDVLHILQKGNRLGTKLELQCPRHPERQIEVSQPDDFLIFSPESGCTLTCDKRLECGHSCTGRCHSDMLHSAFKCLEDCPRSKKGCDHSCPLQCGDPCDKKCYFEMHNINLLLQCGHSVKHAECWQAQDPASIQCTVLVSRTVPGCNHQVQVQCQVDVASTNYKCNAVCGSRLPCGHECNSLCFRCITREGTEVTSNNHGIYRQICGRNYSTCSHSCSSKCHEGTRCQPCKKQCEVRCGHSKCSKSCSEPCAPCAHQDCLSQCPHSQCEMPCAAPCDWVPCSRRCEKMLSCGHRCPSLCGESCPDPEYCQKCASDEIKDICVDFIEMNTYGEIDLDEEPCIFPYCGHILTVSSMDGQMELGSYYNMDESGRPIELRGPSEPFSISDTKFAVCASCRGSLRNISRYGRIVRRAMLDEATKKFISWSNEQYRILSEAVLTGQENLAHAAVDVSQTIISPTAGTPKKPRSRLKQLKALQAQLGITQRHDPLINIWKRISAHKTKVAQEEQPFHRVADFVKHAKDKRKATALGRQVFQLDESVIQIKGFLLATALLLKCEIIVFSDFVKLRNDGLSQSREVEMDLAIYFTDCENLIKLAHESVHPREEVQGHLFYAHFCVLFQYFSQPEHEDHDDVGQGIYIYRKDGLRHMEQAHEVMEKHPSTTSVLKNEIDAVEKMLKGGEYRPVTSEEIRSVYQAMGREFGSTGTGHWYTCQNGHPFTIGECGRPMEEARCPECDAPIGGRHHVPVEGVSLATGIEDIARGVGGLRI